MPATDFYTCRHTSLPRRGAGRSTPIGIRPLAIRRSLVPGRPFSSTVALAPTRHECPAARTSPRRDVAVVPLVSLTALPRLCAKLDRLGKRSRLCRRAPDEEYPGRRRTKGAGRRGQPSPAPSFFSAPHRYLLPVCLRQAAGFRDLGGVSFDRQSANLAPAGISPRSR